MRPCLQKQNINTLSKVLLLSPWCFVCLMLSEELLVSDTSAFYSLNSQTRRTSKPHWTPASQLKCQDPNGMSPSSVTKSFPQILQFLNCDLMPGLFLSWKEKANSFRMRSTAINQTDLRPEKRVTRKWTRPVATSEVDIWQFYLCPFQVSPPQEVLPKP